MIRGFLSIAFACLGAACWGETITFANISDPHVALYGENNWKMAKDSVRILESVVRYLNGFPHLDFAVLTGDITYDGEPFNLDKAKEILEELSVPYFVIFGNHDVPPVPADAAALAGAPQFSKVSFALTFQGRGFEGPQAYWSAPAPGGIRLIGLDTTLVGTWGGRVSRKQLEWLEKELDLRSEEKVILLAHHALVPYSDLDRGPGKNFVLENAAQVRKILSKHKNIVAVITGHRHASGISEEDEVPYFSNPSITSWPNQFALYELSEAALTMRTIPIAFPDLIREARENLVHSSWRVYFPKLEDQPKLLETFSGPSFYEHRLPVLK